MAVQPSRFPVVASFVNRWKPILVGLISIFAASIVWTQPVLPLWTIEPAVANTFISVIGITDDGRVVSMDNPAEEVVNCRLCVRDAATGHTLSDHIIPDDGIKVLGHSFDHGMLSGDGEWGILTSRFYGRAHVMSLKTGELRYPTLTGVRQILSCSLDGRYAVLETDADVQVPDATSYVGQVLDLKTGKYLFQCQNHGESYFSPTSQKLLTYHFEDDCGRVKIHSLPEGTELLSDCVPQIPQGRWPRSYYWSGDRLYVQYEFSDPGSQISKRLCWSFSTQSHHLTDSRYEPSISSISVNDRTFAHYCLKESRRGVTRVQFPPKDGSLLARLFDTLYDWGIRATSADTEYSWQTLSLLDGRPLGPRIEGLRHDFALSLSGTWLADGGEQLRVWRVPASRSLRRCFCTLLAAGLPWGLFAMQWRRRQAAPA